MKKFYLLLILLNLCFCKVVQAQDSISIVEPEIIAIPTEEDLPTALDVDTLITVREEELPDLRLRLEELNKEYSAPRALTKQLQKFLQRDELQMCPEALYLISNFNNRSYLFDESVTFRDTILVNRLFMPILFDGKYLADNINFFQGDLVKPNYTLKPLYQPDSIFTDYQRAQKSARLAYRYIESHFPTYFKYSYAVLPSEKIKPQVMRKEITENFPLVVKNEVSFEDVEAPKKFIPERRYWTSSFESTMQFSQNYITPNWNGGGDPNLNMLTRQFFKYDFNKDKVQVTNELEIKLNMQTLPSKTDSIHGYKVSDNLLRWHTLFGFKAFSKWFYTIDLSLSTQLAKNYEQNSEKVLAAFLAPMTLNSGIGMKYDLDKTLTKVRHRSIKLNVNIAPFSYNFMYSNRNDLNMDLARHGFKLKENSDELPETVNKYENKLHQLGSKVETNMTFNVNRNISLVTRFYYFTDYHRITAELQNTLNMQISRFFSTRIDIQLRYDDGVALNDTYKHYLQINELLSFGFNYKW